MEKACCFFGHRNVSDKNLLKTKLLQITEKLILEENIETFYLGSKSDFNDLCREVLEEQKEKYPHIERVYIRAEFQYISDSYEKYLLETCDRTYFPEKLKNAGIDRIKDEFNKQLEEWKKSK